MAITTPTTKPACSSKGVLPKSYFPHNYTPVNMFVVQQLSQLAPACEVNAASGWQCQNQRMALLQSSLFRHPLPCATRHIKGTCCSAPASSSAARARCQGLQCLMHTMCNGLHTSRGDGNSATFHNHVGYSAPKL
jgi:hypothetical protein